MKKSMIFAISSLAVSAIAITGMAFGSEGILNLGLKAAGAYSCSSVHFGMNDSTLIAKTYTSPSAFSSDPTTALAEMKENYSSIGGIEITSVSATKVYKNTTDYKLPIKWNSASKRGSLTLKFNKSFVGATIYAAGYYGTKADSSTIKVNNVEKQITNYPSSNCDVAASNAFDVIYVPYVFTFDSTDTLNIAGSTASNGRFFVADIALRLAA